MSPTVGQAIKLRNVLETACSEHECGLSDLTVLAVQNDPYRLDTPRHRRDAEWVARQIERAFRPSQRVHLRGLHYALVVQGNVRKPDRKIYHNTAADDAWLALAVKAARWLGYVPFERISDNRNAEPNIFRMSASTGLGARNLRAGVEWEGEILLDLGELHIPPPPLGASLLWFDRAQPYGLVIFGEKSSLEEVLLPIAERYRANLYLGAGEISDTLIYGMAKDGAEDGRPLIVITCCDFDPAGRQMPVSIGRKLQALHDLFFPDLRFEVVPAVLTVEQVRELGLPSTPLKDTERRADRWREAFGVEQTEVDALATLRPGALQEIIKRALAPYYDTTLAGRITRAKREWEWQAQGIINAHVDADALAEIRRNVENIEAEATQRIEALKIEVAERVAAENDQLEEMVAGIELPEAPALPEVELPVTPPNSIIVSTDWDWSTQTRALKAQKSYGNGEAEA